MTASAARLSRRRRADTLRGSTPHSAELLTFLVHMLDAQETLDAYLEGAWWISSLDDPAARPRLQWNRMPVDQLAGRLAEFAGDLGRAAPPPVADACAGLSGLSLPDAGGRLRGWIDRVTREPDVPPAESDPADELVGRAFLQVVAERFAAGLTGPPRDGDLTCSVCLGRPVVSVLRDEPEVKGRRLLVCVRCASWWGFPRARCAACGSEARDTLVSHEAESIGHVRIDACGSCNSYLKSIDLRRDGLADPFADDVATVELDLWAAEQGLVRLQPNLLGM